MDNFGDAWGWFSTEVHNLACEKGWWVLRTADGPSAGTRSFLECMGLVISELGEAVEAFRKPSCSRVILGHSHAAEELADVIIRLADLCEHFGIDPWEFAHHRIRPELFDPCSIGTKEDIFVYCIDILMDKLSCLDGISRNPIEQIAMISAYLGEAVLENMNGNGLHVAEGIADAILAICQLAHQQHIDLGEALVAKHAYNQSRTYRHGAKLY